MPGDHSVRWTPFLAGLVFGFGGVRPEALRTGTRTLARAVEIANGTDKLARFHAEALRSAAIAKT